MTKEEKDKNRWTTQRFSMAAISFVLVSAVILTFIGKDVGQLAALGALLFTYAGAVAKFNYDSKPDKQEVEDV